MQKRHDPEITTTAPAENNSYARTAIKNVCVFCGSGSGKSPVYQRAALTLGRDLANAGIGLVYGGGSLGLMGEVARAVLGNNGKVTGIIPGFLSEKEKMLRDVDELIVTENMHERKALMFERSDAFVALPGGIGTLEELVEQLTWSQLGRHTKPIIVANIDGFWDPLMGLLKHMSDEQFIRSGLEVVFTVVDKPEEIVSALKNTIRGNGEAPSDVVITAKF